MTTESTPITADALITHAAVVTVDAGDRVLDDGAVAVRDGRIRWIGPSAEAAGTVVADTVVDAGGAILLPGLVNAHSHMAMTLFRGVADDEDLQGFLGIVLPTEEATLSAETVAAGVDLAIAESFRAGITTALDMYFWHDAGQRAADRAGFRLLTGPLIVGGPGADDVDFADRMARAEEELLAIDGPRWLMPHSTYLLDPDQLAEVAALATRADARVHVHVSENEPEVAGVRARFGGTPVDVIERVGLLGTRTTMAHGVVLSDEEITRIAASGAAVVHCPASNLKLASGFCRTTALRRAGVTLGLGTDGCASANDLDLFLAMRLAAVVDPAAIGDPTAMSAREVVRAATMGGAAAVGMADEIGSIEVGKRADLVLLDSMSPALVPSPDPESTLVYSASRADVRSVWCDGRPVLDDRRLTTLDLPAVLARGRAIGTDVLAASRRVTA